MSSSRRGSETLDSINNIAFVNLLGVAVDCPGICSEVFCGDYFGYRMVSVADTALVEEVSNGEPDRFTKDFLKFSPGADLLLESFGRGLFIAGTEDPEWYVAHRILRAPFSSRGVKSMLPLMCQQADELVKALRRDVGHGGSLYIDTWVTKMALETIAVCGLGTSLGCFESSEKPPLVVCLDKVIRGLMTLSRCPRLLRPFFMPIRTFEFCRESRRLRQYCLELIEQRASRTAEDSRKDLLDAMCPEPVLMDMLLLGFCDRWKPKLRDAQGEHF